MLRVAHMTLAASRVGRLGQTTVIGGAQTRNYLTSLLYLLGFTVAFAMYFGLGIQRSLCLESLASLPNLVLLNRGAS